MPVAFISTRTSPAFGPSRSSSMISSGFFASNATAARVFICHISLKILLGLGCSSLSSFSFRRSFLDNRLVLGTTWFAGTRMSIRPCRRSIARLGRTSRQTIVADNNFVATATVPVELLQRYYGATYTPPPTSIHRVGYVNLTGELGHAPPLQRSKSGLVRCYSWRTPLCSKKCVDRFRARRASDAIGCPGSKSP